MKRRQFLAAGASFAGALAIPSGRCQPAAANRAAVVIGVDKVGSLQRLRAAGSGARSVADWLAGEGFEVTLFVDDAKPVVAAELTVAIRELVNRGTLDQLVVYFAGHGFVSGSLSEFWLLSDAPEDANAAVSLTESRELARQSGIPNVVFISDACRSRADSLQAERMHGTVIFPSKGARTNVACDVDRFLATGIGDPAWEVPIAESTAAYQGIYTACFLDAFKRPCATMVQLADGKPVVPNRRLKNYLAQEVPKRAQAASIRLSQHPDAEVCSDEPTYVGHVSAAGPFSQCAVAVTVSDVATRAVGASIGGGTPQISDTAVSALAASSGFNAATETVARARGLPAQLSARTGFTISGQRIEAVVARPGIRTDFANASGGSPSALIQVDVGTARAASVALRFADGSGTVLAALDEFVGNVAVDEGRVANVSYVPSRQSPMRSVYESESSRLDQLHAAVAAAARYGVFRIEGPRETRNRTAAQLADRIRMLKGIDPTLGLYAAYAYSDAGLPEQVRSVRGYMHGDLGIDVFDVAMLTGELSGRTLGGPGSVFPFCPMLSQGWALLRVRDVRLPESVTAVRDHLRPSLWLTLDRGGMEIVETALRAGRVG